MVSSPGHCQHALPLIRALVAVATVAALVGSGCGGGSGPGAPTVAVSGRISLPAGSSLQMGALRVSGSIDRRHPASDGRFTLEQPGTAPAIVSVLDADGDLVLCGYLAGTGAVRGDGELSAKSTATALLFQATGAWGLPEGATAAALALIAASPQSAAVASVIEARLVADPKALVVGDPEVKAAIAAARDALVPGSISGRAAHIRPGRAVLADRRASRADEPQATMLAITSQNPLHALQLGPMDEADGLQVRHTRRRHCYYFLYEKGWHDTRGEEHNYAPDSRPLAGEGYISATNGLAGVIGSLVDVAADNVAYKPVEVGPIAVQMHADATKTHYTMMVVGCGMTDTEPPPEVKGNARFGIWNDARYGMSALSLIKDVLLPTVFACISPDAVKDLTAVEMSEAALDILGAATQSGLDASVALSQGDVRAAGLSIMKGIASDELFRTKVAEIVAKRLLRAYAPATVNALLAEFGASLNVWLKLFDVGLTGWDLGMVINDIAKSCPFVQFDIDLLTPTVRVVPDLIGVKPGNTGDFSVTKGTVAGAVFQYHATTSGAIGSLQGGPGYTTMGTDIWTSTPEFRYYVGPDEADGQEDAVTVEVFRQLTAGGTRQFVGRSAAKIVVSASTVTLSPPVTDAEPRTYNALTASIDPPVPAPYTVLYHWSNPGTAGHLKGGLDEFDSTTPGVFYLAGDSEGHDTVTVTAYRVLGEQKVPLGSSRALINVTGGTWVPVTYKQVGPTVVELGDAEHPNTWVVYGLACMWDPPAGCTLWFDSDSSGSYPVPYHNDYTFHDPLAHGTADQLGFRAHRCYFAMGGARQVTWMGLQHEIDICNGAMDASRASWRRHCGDSVFCR